MFYLTVRWNGGSPLEGFDFAQVPSNPGVYAFTEYPTWPRPNRRLLAKDDADYESQIEFLRGEPCLLYIGKAKTLRTRVRGYRFKPYLEIRRKSGEPRHVADPHKGRALLHAHQYFAGDIFLWWAETPTPEAAEEALIEELNPVLNTAGMVFYHSRDD